MTGTSTRGRRIVFLTGTRADFGKIKTLLTALDLSGQFDIYLFVTGMHMLSRYGSTWEEVRAAGVGHLYTFINQNEDDSMEVVFSKTVSGFSDYVKEIQPDLVVVHGDRVETLAGATVGALAGILVAHIEGGEVSGTVDELIRHAVTKLAHTHFVSNEQARQRVLQLGEEDSSVHVIGSPDIDVMDSGNLPTLDEVRHPYEIPFSEFGIVIFHPVTTELTGIGQDAETLVDYILGAGENFVVVMPNNDAGAHLIVEQYERLRDHKNIRLFPSMRFEYFLSALRSAKFILGNSSAGVREAPHFGVPAVNIGTRQFRRSSSSMVVNSEITFEALGNAVAEAVSLPRTPDSHFGEGNSAQQFLGRILADGFWQTSVQKAFVDRHSLENSPDLEESGSRPIVPVSERSHHD